jgi:peptidyl-prolyl cis-trans isomerase B (cyclophilin B)
MDKQPVASLLSVADIDGPRTLLPPLSSLLPPPSSRLDFAVAIIHHSDQTMSKIATIETNRGTMKAELYEKEAPKTVANFERLANSGFYDGTKFHRVIKDFMVQGGDPYSKGGEHAKGPVGTGGPGYKIDCETAGNPHKHEVGALSMAHAGKNTGGSQFFIVLSEQNTRHLNGVHTVFGKVIEGGDVVPKINQNDTVTKARVTSAPGA